MEDPNSPAIFEGVDTSRLLKKEQEKKLLELKSHINSVLMKTDWVNTTEFFTSKQKKIQDIKKLRKAQWKIYQDLKQEIKDSDWISCRDMKVKDRLQSNGFFDER